MHFKFLFVIFGKTPQTTVDNHLSLKVGVNLAFGQFLCELGNCDRYV